MNLTIRNPLTLGYYTEYPKVKKIDQTLVKITGNLTKDIFSNFIYFSRDAIKTLPKNYSIYWQGSCIYLLCIEKNVALNYMWCCLDDVSNVDDLKFYGGCFTNSTKEEQACNLFRSLVTDITTTMVRYYRDHNIKTIY